MHAVLRDFPSPHIVCDVCGSPTVDRLGSGSPARLVRFGFMGETASGTSASALDVTLSSGDSCTGNVRRVTRDEIADAVG